MAKRKKQSSKSRQSDLASIPSQNTFDEKREQQNARMRRSEQLRIARAQEAARHAEIAFRMQNVRQLVASIGPDSGNGTTAKSKRAGRSTPKGLSPANITARSTAIVGQEGPSNARRDVSPSPPILKKPSQGSVQSSVLQTSPQSHNQRPIGPQAAVRTLATDAQNLGIVYI